ncbi:MAG: beta-ketoacyl synthase chain length factor [Saprospiraceae bacterium]|nr:beta-ketoacyl synthase chain length factor [Saprospiraceae bacterium]
MFKAYINGLACISPQNTLDPTYFMDEVISYQDSNMWCIEPKYKQYINPRMVRRMGRVIRMGVTTANLAMKEAGFEKVDAIITGTAMGCIEDTEKFIKRMIESDEGLLTPTAFIQSTHNTIGGQIALAHKNTSYNMTYVHRGLSFESALLDALLKFAEGDAKQILLGSTDELTKNNEAFYKELGCARIENVSNLDMFKVNKQHLLETSTKLEKGTQFGEGAGFFALSSERQENSYAYFRGVNMIYRPKGLKHIQEEILSFLSRIDLSLDEIDLVLLGNNGDRRFDYFYHNLEQNLFKNTGIAYFKHLCGEYSTSSCFASWVAAKILKNQAVPETILASINAPKKLNNILIYNQYQATNHVVIAMSK